MSWIARMQERLSDRAHSGGDAFARQAGWTTRMYRDPRFDQRRAEPSRAAQPRGAPR